MEAGGECRIPSSFDSWLHEYKTRKVNTGREQKRQQEGAGTGIQKLEMMILIALSTTPELHAVASP